MTVHNAASSKILAALSDTENDTLVFALAELHMESRLFKRTADFQTVIWGTSTAGDGFEWLFRSISTLEDLTNFPLRWAEKITEAWAASFFFSVRKPWANIANETHALYSINTQLYQFGGQFAYRNRNLPLRIAKGSA